MPQLEWVGFSFLGFGFGFGFGLLLLVVGLLLLGCWVVGGSKAARLPVKRDGPNEG